MVVNTYLFKSFLIYFLPFLFSLTVYSFAEFDLAELKSFFQIILIFCFIVYNIHIIKCKLFFQPLSFLVNLTTIYFLIGGNNWIERGATVDFNNEFFVLIYLSFLLLCCNIGFYLGGFRKKKKSNYKVDYRVVKIVTYSGIIAILLDFIFIGGIPIFSGNAIRGASMPLFRLFFLLGGFSSIILFHKYKKKKLVFIFILLAVASGYRTFVLVYSFYIFIYIMNYLRFSLFKKVLYMILGFCFFISINLLKLYRDISEFGEMQYLSILKEEGLSEDYIYLSPILHTVREGPQIFQKIRNSNFEFGNGTYFLENLSTILPGEQRGYGSIFNDITNAPTDNTKTATIVGAFYIENGIFSIILIASFLGCIIGYLFQQYYNSKKSLFKFIAYSYFISFLAIWTHGGSPLSPTFLLSSFLFHIVLKRVNLAR